jgi:hypothetical protein
MRLSTPQPRWAFEIWARALGDEVCARDTTLPLPAVRRLWWRVRGAVVTFVMRRCWRWC